MAHDSPGTTATAAPAFLERIEQQIDKIVAQKEKETRLTAIKTVKPGYGRYDPTHAYQEQAQRLLAKGGENTDLAKMDKMIATDMAKSGHFNVAEIERGIR